MKTVPRSDRSAASLSRITAILTASLFFCIAPHAYGAESPHKVQPTPGGLSPTPDIVSILFSNKQALFQWQGFGGPYQLETRDSAGTGVWRSAGAPVNGKSTEVLLRTGRLGFFRVRAPEPGFASAEVCLECHSQTHRNWSQTIHANALNSLKAIGQQGNADCVKCHTVGAGLSTGFRSEAVTPQFAGVQCESCHGPAAAHVSDPERLSTRPVITDSAELCGGCHNGFHHPTYDEFKTAKHSRVDPHVQEYFRDPKTGTARMESCGACHSGAVRLAMLKSAAGAPLKLPTGDHAAQTGITCTVCHDSHKPNLDDTHSLRHPVFSTNFYSYSTSTNTTFAAQYKATGKNIQTCGQCHNSRGASPNDTARPPHHSPQYNLLIGDIGFELGYVPQRIQSGHTRIQKQCTHCHTHRHDPDEPSEADPVYTGHAFEATLHACAECHQSETKAEEMIASTQGEIKTKIQELKGLLETWGELKAPVALRNKYGKLAWEYNTAGQISNPSGSASIKGPTSAEQTDVPADIKKARMYIYMVEHDGSYGVHNAKYARYLLEQAKTNVTTLLNAP